MGSPWLDSKGLLKFCASESRYAVCVRGLWTLKSDAKASTEFTFPNIVDIISIFAIERSTGSWLRESPRGVKDKHSSDRLRAPESAEVNWNGGFLVHYLPANFSFSKLSSMALWLGFSKKGKFSISVNPSEIMCKMSESKGTKWISAGVKPSKLLKSSSEYSR